MGFTCTKVLNSCPRPGKSWAGKQTCTPTEPVRNQGTTGGPAGNQDRLREWRKNSGLHVESNMTKEREGRKQGCDPGL